MAGRRRVTPGCACLPPTSHTRWRHDRVSALPTRAFPSCASTFPNRRGRWNTPGELTHYFCDTPDEAWAEFLRHEEIVDAEDLLTIRRGLWVVEIGDEPPARPELLPQTLAGGPVTWPDCQREASRLWSRGEAGMDGDFGCTPSRWRPRLAGGGEGSVPASPGMARCSRSSGPRPDLVGWAAVAAGRPGEELLSRVRHY